MSQPIQNRTCRICLDTECTSIVCLDDENDCLELLEFSVGLVLKPEDNPRVLCTQCAEQVKSYAEFKKQCYKSDVLWKSVVKFEVECLENNNLPKTVKDEKEYSDDGLDNNNSPDIETYFESSNNIADQKICSGDGKYMYVNNGIEFKSKARCKRSTCDVNATDDDEAKKDETVKNSNIDVNNIENGHLICLKCSKVYANKKWLQRHITMCCGKFKKDTGVTDIKPNNKALLCGICDFVNSDVAILNQHVNEHFINNELNCKLCNFTGYDLASMESHRYKHVSNKLKSRKCHECNKTCGSPLSHEFHYRSVHLGKPGGVCTLCNNREFKVFKTWRRHEMAHTVTKYICDHCGRKFLYRYMIESHLMDHSDVKNYCCHECGKRFKRAQGLKLHVSTVHVKTGPLNCTHCTRVFKSPHTLEKHMKRMLAEKSYRCEVCLKCYASEKALKKHEYWHSDERPHCCDICGSSYKAKSQLKLHMRKHTGEKPYLCFQCYKTFHSSSQLKRHKSVHTGIRPVKCTSCDKTFYNNGARLAHCARRHKTEDNYRPD